MSGDKTESNGVYSRDISGGKLYLTADSTAAIAKVVEFKLTSTDKTYYFKDITPVTDTTYLDVYSPSSCDSIVCSKVIDLVIVFDDLIGGVNNAAATRQKWTRDYWISLFHSFSEKGMTEVGFAIVTMKSRIGLDFIIPTTQSQWNNVDLTINNMYLAVPDSESGNVANGMNLAMKMFDKSPRKTTAQRVVIFFSDGWEAQGGGQGSSAFNAVEKLKNTYNAFFISQETGLNVGQGSWASTLVTFASEKADGTKAFYNPATDGGFDKIRDTLVNDLCKLNEDLSSCGTNCKGLCTCGATCICPDCSAPDD